MTSSAPEEKLETVEIRRTPKFLPFMITGGVLGLAVGFILWLSANASRELLGYLITYSAGIGVALGLIAATIIETITRRRTKRVTATKLEG